MSLTALDRSTTPPTPRELECDSTGALKVTGGTGGGGSSSGLTNTELRAAALPVASVDLGAKADVRAVWYDSAASLVALLKLSIAAYIGAGSHAYGYTSGQLTTDAWTLFGTTRVKTYTYTAGVLTAESDWL